MKQFSSHPLEREVNGLNKSGPLEIINQFGDSVELEPDCSCIGESSRLPVYPPLLYFSVSTSLSYTALLCAALSLVRITMLIFLRT